MAQREPAALAIQMYRPDPGKFDAHLLRYGERAVGARVVGDGDDERKGEVTGQIRVQLADAVRQDFRLVIGRDGDLDQRIA